MLPLRHRRFWIALSTALVLLVVLGSLLPGMPFSPPGQLDKLQHFFVYVVLALWFTGLFPRARYGWVAAALVALGLALELLQQAMSLGRVGEALDMTANAMGVAVGIVLATVATGGWARQVESWLSRN